MIALLLAFTCTMELLKEEFPRPIVEEQLALYKIVSPRSGRIARELIRRSGEVDSLAKSWAEEMGSPTSPLVLGNLRKKASFRIFQEVLLEAGVENPQAVFEIYEGILEEKASCQRSIYRNESK